MSDQSSIPRIHTLEPEVYNQIAAGEVIERPSSVVKELIENAIDASASRITVQLKQGGIQSIRVVDNGTGIHPDDLPLTVESHTTSKLKTSSDLNLINSFGFRGEALASVASISKFKLQSSTGESRLGKEISFSPDRKIISKPCPHAKGTSVEADELFFNTPVRKKFLRSVNTEYQHALNIFKIISLCHFDISFKFQHNNRMILNLANSNGDYSRRLYAILGKEFAKKMTAFNFNHEDMHLWGWLGSPEIARNQTDKQYLYINKRPVRDKNIQHAIQLAFQDQLYTGRHPCYVLYLQVNPSLIDVNVHPGKLEVRFQQPRNIHDFVHHCLTQVLTGNDQNDFKSYTESTEVGVDTVPLEVEEPVVEYLVEKDIKKKTTNVKFDSGSFIELNDRICIYQVDEEFLLIDKHLAREQKTKEILDYQLQRNRKIIGRPLLIPFEYLSKTQNIDLIEKQEHVLIQFGFEFRRNSDEQIVVKQLPECVRYMDVRKFLDDFIDMVEHANNSDLETSMTDLIAQHANDELPQKSSNDEIKSLITYCMKRNVSDTSQEQTFFRMLDEQSLIKIINQS